MRDYSGGLGGAGAGVAGGSGYYDNRYGGGNRIPYDSRYDTRTDNRYDTRYDTRYDNRYDNRYESRYPTDDRVYYNRDPYYRDRYDDRNYRPNDQTYR